jgi:hypothetical protein
VVEEIRNGGSSADCFVRDVRHPQIAIGWGPTALYRLATPFIFGATAQVFQEPISHTFCDYYGTGFEAWWGCCCPAACSGSSIPPRWRSTSYVFEYGVVNPDRHDKSFCFSITVGCQVLVCRNSVLVCRACSKA